MIEDKWLKAREISGHNPTTFMVKAANVNYDQGNILIPLQDEVDSLERRLAEKQPLHAALTSISGLTTSADKMIYTTALNTYAVTPLTSLARNLLDDTTQQTMRTTIDALGKSETAVRSVADQNGNTINTTYATRAEAYSQISDPAVTVSGSTRKFEGTIKTVTNVSTTINYQAIVTHQNVSTANSDYPILLTANAGQSSNTIHETVNFSTKIKANPNTGTITATTFSGSLSGNATTATTLATERLISVNLQTASTSGTKFNGSKDVTIGVTGTLQVSNGGTGATSVANIQAGKDSSGNTITSTYVKSVSVSNGVMTVTKGDNTTSTATVSVPVSDASTSNKGIVQIGSNISVSNGTISLTSSNVTSALGFTPLSTTGTAAKATADGSGDNIRTTYVKSVTVNNGTMTVTKGDGTTNTAEVGSQFTLTASDITSALGFTPLSSSGTANKANTLSTARNIDGVSFNGGADISHYGSATGADNDTTKTVSCANFNLVTGSRIIVYFPNGHTGSSLSLNVNSKGAKTALYNGSAITAGILEVRGVYEFVYDGTQFRLINDPSGTVTSKMSEYIKQGDAVSAAETANTLNTTARINGLLFNGSTNVNSFATCSTAAGTAAKAVTVNNFATTLYAGLQVTVKFTYKNTATNPQLKVNNLTAKDIQYRGYNIPAGALAQNSVYTLVYTGSVWEIVGSVTWAE